MHARRLAEVRRSSSMIPIFTLFSGRPVSASIWLNTEQAKATSSGPCSFGLTMYILPVREFLFVERRSRSPATIVTTASTSPS